MPRTIRARFLLSSVLTILTALVVIALTVPQIARDHETEVLGARLASDAAISAAMRSARATPMRSTRSRIASQLTRRFRVTFIGTGSFSDPSKATGRDEERYAALVRVSDAIRERIGRELLAS